MTKADTVSKETLAAMLTEAGFAFEETQNFYKGLMTDGGSRSQVWLLDFTADDLGGCAENDLYSAVGPADDPAHVKAACELAGRKRRGGIVVLFNKIFCKIEVPQGVDTGTLRAQIFGICKMADEMEAELFGTDDC